jgi:hypothetical protein
MTTHFEKYIEVFLKQSCEFLKKDNNNKLELKIENPMCRLRDRRLTVRINSGRRMIDLIYYS